MTSRKARFHCILAAAIVASSYSVAHGADDSSPSPEAQRFEAAKKAIRDQQRDKILDYIERMKQKVQTTWHAPAHKGLEITKVRADLDAAGKVIDCKVLTASKSEKEDASILAFIKGTSFDSLPAAMDKISLFWTFMSDGSMNVVEFANAPEANAYNQELLGAAIKPPGTRDASGFTLSSPRPSFGAQKDIDFGPYMADLQRRLKRAWFPPKGLEAKRVTILFSINKSGDISNLRVKQPSEYPEADAAALKAASTASPFRPLPEGANDPTDIQFTFDYNVFGGGGHGAFRTF